MIWQQHLPIHGDVEMTPLYDNGLLFVGARNFQDDPTTSSGQRAGPSPIWALNASDGSIKWTAYVPGLTHGPPIVMNGFLYAGSSGGDASVGCVAGGIYTFDETTGSTGQSWQVVTGATDGGSVWSPISTDGTNIYYGTGNTCVASPLNDSIAASNSALAPLWHYSTDDNWGYDDDVGGGVSLSGTTGYVMTKSGAFYAIDLRTGAPIWSFQTSAPLSYGGFSTPTSAAGWIVFGGGYRELADSTTFGGWLFGISANGTQHWVINTAAGMLSSPISANDLVFTEADSSLDAINPANGQVLWSFATAGAFKASPAMTSQGIYAADLSGMIYAFGLSSQNSAAKTRLLPMHATGGRPHIPPMCAPQILRPVQVHERNRLNRANA